MRTVICPYCGQRAVLVTGETIYNHRPDLWNDWNQIYCDLHRGDDSRRNDALQFFEDHQDEMLDGVEMLWDAGFSYYDYQVAKIERGAVAVNLEMQNLLFDESQFIFPMAGAVYFEVADEGLLRFTKDGTERTYERRVAWDKIEGVTLFLDWAGGKDSLDNAYACISVVLWESVRFSSEKYCYIVDTWMERKPPSEQVKALFELEKKWNQYPVKAAIEAFPQDATRANHDWFLHLFKETARSYQSNMGVQFLPRHVNKIERITKLEPKIANGWLAFNAALPENYLSQFVQFPTHEFLDAPDSAEGALHFPPSAKRPDRRETHTSNQVVLTR